MTSEELNKLRGYHFSLVDQRKVFKDCKKNTSIENYPVDILEAEINKINTDFPNILSPFNKNQFFTYAAINGRANYSINGVLSYLATAINKLRILVDDSGNSPVTETKKFSFIQSDELQKIIERDYQELQRAYIAKCWKSTIILSGGSIEAILIDLLQQNLSDALSSLSAPKDTDITKWDLSDLIKVSVELKLLSPSIDKLSHSVREYRNLIHPGNEIRNKLVIEEEEAKIAIEILNILHRELANK